MKLHRLSGGMYSVKFRGLESVLITSSWAEAMEVAWRLGGGK